MSNWASNARDPYASPSTYINTRYPVNMPTGKPVVKKPNAWQQWAGTPSGNSDLTINSQFREDGVTPTVRETAQESFARNNPNYKGMLAGESAISNVVGVAPQPLTNQQNYQQNYTGIPASALFEQARNWRAP